MTLSGKNVLITGIDGFVGSHLANELEKHGSRVFGVSKTVEGKNIYKIDIANFKELKLLFHKHKIQICFHLAGISLVEQGQKNPYETFSINILGAINILEITRIYNLERVIIASTAHVYGDNTPPFKENFFPRPSRPYETSKASADLIAQSYADTFNLPVLIPRFVNIYGPGDKNFTRIIPKTIKSVLNNQSPEMWGGDSLRDYLYIDDAIAAYIKLGQTDIEKIGKSRILNFGGGNKETVEQVIMNIIEISGKNLNIKKVDQGRAYEITSQYVSYAKAKKILGWSPKVKLEDGLKRTISWYKKEESL